MAMVSNAVILVGIPRRDYAPRASSLITYPLT